MKKCPKHAGFKCHEYKTSILRSSTLYYFFIKRPLYGCFTNVFQNVHDTPVAIKHGEDRTMIVFNSDWNTVIQNRYIKHFCFCNYTQKQLVFLCNSELDSFWQLFLLIYILWWFLLNMIKALFCHTCFPYCHFIRVFSFFFCNFTFCKNLKLPIFLGNQLLSDAIS